MPPKVTASRAKKATKKKEEEEEEVEEEVQEEEQEEEEEVQEKQGSSKRKQTKAVSEESADSSKKSKGKAEATEEEEAKVTQVTDSNGKKMKILTWNVNGLRAAVKKGFVKVITDNNPDVVCLGEVKCSLKEFPESKQLPGYKFFWNESTSQKGYAGTAVFSKVEPKSVKYGLGAKKHDEEGRTITVEYDTFFLINTYVPNSGQTLDRLGYRTKEWDPDLLAHLKKLEASKPVIWTGDLNVAHQDIDIHDPKNNHKTAGFTDEERKNFGDLLKQGFIDVYRQFYPAEKNCYTYWSYRFQAKAKNKGWRLDYFVASAALKNKLLSTSVLRNAEGSDHVPIVLEVQDS